MNEKKLNVLFISSWYPNKMRPVLGIFVKRYAAALTKNCNVSAIYVCADTDKSIEESTEDNIYTIRCYYKKVKNKIPLYSHLIRLLRYILSWKRALTLYKQKKGEPDIINSAIVFPASIIALYLKFSWKVPYIISEHWTGYLPEDGRYKGILMKWFSQMTIKHASAVVTDSSRLKNKMQELGLTNEYYAIPNVVDTTQFTLTESTKTSARTNFIHISSFDEEQKNVSGILRAFARIHAENRDITLTLVGEGDTKTMLQELAGSLHMNEAVTFTGLKTGKELVVLLQQADAFILFSNYENMPCVMLEAMACGLPVIGTRTGDVPDVINTKNGILIDARDEGQLYDAMMAILKNKTAYNPSDIREGVVNKVSPDEIAKQFLTVYNKVLHKAK